MDIKQTEKVLRSLANETRIRIYKLLIEYKKIGIYSGKISEILNVPQNTISFHLTNLKNTNLVYCEKKGKNCIYFPNKKTIDDLKEFLFKNCCKAKENNHCAQP
jgi:ArsR family transcriptional regulator, arsenate/arsenite/antimonite-responsive transcriptional repressor